MDNFHITKLYKGAFMSYTLMKLAFVAEDTSSENREEHIEENTMTNVSCDAMEIARKEKAKLACTGVELMQIELNLLV